MLRDQQSAFAHAVLQGAFDDAIAVCDGAPSRIRLGLRIYANNAAHAMVTAARDMYPKTASLLGEDFSALALHYARTAAPPAAVIGEALCDFPLFLETIEGIDPRAADCACFERLWLQAYHAADATPLRPDRFSSLSPEEFAAARLAFHPSLRIYRPRFTSAPIGDETWLHLSRACAFLRPAFNVETLALTAAGCSAFERLRTGTTVGETLDASEEPDDALQDLGRLFAAGAVTELL